MPFRICEIRVIRGSIPPHRFALCPGSRLEYAHRWWAAQRTRAPSGRLRGRPEALHPAPHPPKAMALDLKTRVLVAEDNPNLRKVIVNIVKKIGYADIVEAEDGTQAWEKVEAGGIGLVLTD